MPDPQPNPADARIGVKPNDGASQPGPSSHPSSQLDLGSLSLGPALDSIRRLYQAANPVPSVGSNLLTRSIQSITSWAKDAIAAPVAAPQNEHLAALQTGFTDLCSWLSGADKALAQPRCSTVQSFFSEASDRLTRLREARADYVRRTDSPSEEVDSYLKDFDRNIEDLEQQLTELRREGANRIRGCRAVEPSKQDELLGCWNESCDTNFRSCERQIERLRRQRAAYEEAMRLPDGTSEERTTKERLLQQASGQITELSGQTKGIFTDAIRGLQQDFYDRARDIDPRGAVALRSDMDDLFSRSIAQIESISDNLDRTSMGLYSGTDRYSTALRTQWTPMLTPLASGRYGATALYFTPEQGLSSFDRLLDQADAALQRFSADSIHTVATVLDRPDSLQAQFTQVQDANAFDQPILPRPLAADAVVTALDETRKQLMQLLTGIDVSVEEEPVAMTAVETQDEEIVVSRTEHEVDPEVDPAEAEPVESNPELVAAVDEEIDTEVSQIEPTPQDQPSVVPDIVTNDGLIQRNLALKSGAKPQESDNA